MLDIKVMTVLVIYIRAMTTYSNNLTLVELHISVIAIRSFTDLL